MAGPTAWISASSTEEDCCSHIVLRMRLLINVGRFVMVQVGWTCYCDDGEHAFAICTIEIQICPELSFEGQRRNCPFQTKQPARARLNRRRSNRLLVNW